MWRTVSSVSPRTITSAWRVGRTLYLMTRGNARVSITVECPFQYKLSSSQFMKSNCSLKHKCHFWKKNCHWLQRNLSKWQLSVQPVRKISSHVDISQIAKFMEPIWGPPGSCRPQMGPILAPRTLLSGFCFNADIKMSVGSSYLYSGKS